MRRIDKANALSDEELNASKHHLFSSFYSGTLILVCMYVCMYVYLIDLSPLGLFRARCYLEQIQLVVRVGPELGI